MVAYFKLQNNLFMLGGGLAGFLLGVLNYNGLILPFAGATSIFFIALLAIIGVVLGRILASVWANRRIRALTALLYQECRPGEFLERFSPIVKKTPDTAVEYIDGNVKLAYACEALGEFDKGLAILSALQPEKLKMHQLVGTALIENQKMRLYLLKEETENAARQLEVLKDLAKLAEGRAKTLTENLLQCVRLAENWIKALQGEPGDTSYIREEIDLAGNRIHKSEMMILLARMKRLERKEEEAAALLREAEVVGRGLYAAQKAGQLLQMNENYEK